MANIKVPINAILPPGFVDIGQFLAGAWHNNAESLILLPATLKAVIDGDIPNPVTYEDWKTLYGAAPNYSALSNTKENEHKKLVFYNKFLSIDETLEALKCIKASEGDDVLLEDDGVTPQTDDDGIYLLED